jgi:hypothetical protein
MQGKHLKHASRTVIIPAREIWPHHVSIHQEIMMKVVAARH